MLKKQINSIIENIEITTGGQIIHKGSPQLNFISKNHNSLLDDLKQIIYDEYYLNKKVATFEITRDFKRQLKRANNTKAVPHRGWVIIHINNDNSVVVEMGNRRLLAKSGDFIANKHFGSNLTLNNNVTLYNKSDYSDDNGVFYHVFGKAIGDRFNESLLRFYFNLRPSGMPILIDFLTSVINPIEIPFQFKCLHDCTNYGRADAGVLYFEKRFFFDLISILKDAKKLVAIHSNPDTPLFARRLAPGIAFAENPPDPNESFGTSRCRLIAEAIVEAHENSVEDVKSYVLDYVEQKGYDLDHFYLNPGSQFEYDFSAFDNIK